MGHFAPGEFFENMLQLKHLVYILKEFEEMATFI